MAQADIQGKLEKALEQAGVYAAVGVDERSVTLSGEVDTEESRQAAEDIVRAIAPDREIDNGLEVQDILPVDVEGFQTEAGAADNLTVTREELDAGDSMIEPGFNDQPVTTAIEDVVDEQEESYFPPTDPVVEPGARDNGDIVGGFSSTALETPGPERSASDGRIGDEALEDAVRRRLIADASTTDLNIKVTARNGVVVLEGGVAGIEDAENAESVAATVPGVKDVIDQIDVEE